jgi:hypothetical protein
MSLLKTSKERFKMMRENDYESLWEEVSSFCTKHNIDILNMDDEYKLRERSRRKSQMIINLHYFRYELDDCFTETSTELLLYVAYLNLTDSFSIFNKGSLFALLFFIPMNSL